MKHPNFDLACVLALAICAHQVVAMGGEESKQFEISTEATDHCDDEASRTATPSPQAAHEGVEAEELQQVDEFEEPGLIWMDTSRERAIFISEEKLNGQSLEKISNLRSLEMSLKIRQQPGVYGYMFPGGIVPECEDRIRQRGPQGSAPEPKALPRLILERPNVFIGTVEEVVPGWDAWGSHVSVMALVKVEEPLVREGHDNLLRKDALVKILFPGGRLTIDGTEICHKVEKNFYRPRHGDRLLVTGILWEQNPTFFAQSYIFPITGTKIQTQPYRELRLDAKPADLLELKTCAVGLGDNRERGAK